MAGKAEGGTSCARCAGERISIHLHSSLASEVGTGEEGEEEAAEHRERREMPGEAVCWLL